MLQIKNLTLKANETILVDDLNFTLNYGETLAIVGESGSGKSLTSLAIMGLLPKQVHITHGEIIFESENLLLKPEKDLRRLRGKVISMIFQEPMTSLNPLMHCGLQVTEVIMLHEKVSYQEAKKLTLKLFEEVQLPRKEVLFESYPYQLSGGQKQRVMIAMAMACNPQLIIADEPTTALDASVQRGIVALLQQMQQRRQCGIIFITHDLHLASTIAHHTLVMQQGKAVELNTTAEIFTHPQQKYTKALLQCMPDLKVKKDWLPTLDDIIHDRKIETYAKTVNRAEEVLVSMEALNLHYEKQKFIFGKKEVFQALSNINLQIFKGETLALVGESGSGKSTLGKALLGLEKNITGTIKFNIPSSKTHHFASMVFQDPFGSLNPQHTIGNAIMEPMWVHRVYPTKMECKKQVFAILEKVGLLPEHFNRYPHEFSGGQRQRIAIARALVLNPQFIVLDEAVSALDVSVQAQILNLLKQLQLEFGFTYLFITHDLSVVRFIADRVVVLSKGEIQEIATADALFLNPQSEYTKYLLECAG
ncbi:MAG: ABC transporter ATP-binding protein [Bacteroidetes bacterium]|nr:ABC transporter ATP-binding protein [Bacteroidota bacterium]